MYNKNALSKDRKRREIKKINPSKNSPLYKKINKRSLQGSLDNRKWKYM